MWITRRLAEPLSCLTSSDKVSFVSFLWDPSESVTASPHFNVVVIAGWSHGPSCGSDTLTNIFKII